MRPDLQHIRFHGLVTAGAGRARRLPASMTARAAPLSFDQPVLAMGSLGRDVLWRSGLNPDAYRDAPVLRRTKACFRALRVSGDDEARQAIAPGGDALGRALDTLLLGVSGFFRDLEVFDTLRAQVLPRLASGGGALRVFERRVLERRRAVQRGDAAPRSWGARAHPARGSRLPRERHCERHARAIRSRTLP